MAEGDTTKDYLISLFTDDGSPNFDLLQRNIDLLRDSEETDEDFYYTGTIIPENLLYIKFKSKEEGIDWRKFQIWTDDSLIVEMLIDCYGSVMKGINYFKIWDRDNNLVQDPIIDPFAGNVNFNVAEFNDFCHDVFPLILQMVAVKVQEKEDQENQEQQADFDNYRRDFLNLINNIVK